MLALLGGTAARLIAYALIALYVALLLLRVDGPTLGPDAKLLPVVLAVVTVVFAAHGRDAVTRSSAPRT